MKINRFLLLVLSGVVSFSYAQIKITFFEVGQGHCTLICAPNEAPILVDGGSLSADYTGITRESFKTARIKEIVKKIEEHARVTGKFELVVIVSHPDPDHYNWLEKIMQDCISLKVRIARVILGCAKKIYDDARKYKEFPALLKKISEPAVALGGAPLMAAGDELLTEVTYLTEKGDTQVPTIIRREGAFLCEILPAKACAVKKAVNDGSLVVRIQYGNLSCLLMGDATDTTLDHLIKYWAGISKVHLLQASHHGSDQHGCNRTSWLNLIQPSAIVFSSGKQAGKMELGKVPKGNKLPHIGTAVRMLPLLPIVNDGSYHLLFTGKPVNAPDENLQALERVKFTNGYRMGAIQTSLHGTLSNGTEVVAWDIADTVLPPPQFSREESGKSVNFATEKEAVLKGLIDPRYGITGCFGTSVYRYINLSDLAMDDAVEADNTSITDLLSRLITHGTALKIFLADRNRLGRETTMDLLVRLFDARKAILAKLSLLNNEFSENQMQRLTTLDPQAARIVISRRALEIAQPKAVLQAPITPEKAKIQVRPKVDSPLAVLNVD